MKPVCLVIGAGAGIGGTVGTKFASEGYHAVLCRRSDKEGLDKLVDGIKSAGGEATGLLLNAIDDNAIEDAVTHVEANIGPIETVIYIIATILLDEDLRAQTGMTFQELNFNSATALSFQLMLGSMRYTGALQPTAVQHSPGEPCMKPLDVFSLPIQWPSYIPASLHMRAYSMLGMGYIMLASQQV